MHVAKLLACLIGTSSISVTAQSLSPGEGIILAIDSVTFLSQDNLERAQNLTEENALEIGGEIVQGFGAIVKTVTGALSNVTILKFPSVIPDVDQHAICNSFRSFILIHQQLLSIVIGEKSILSATPFTAPLGTVLRSLEGVVDTFAFAVINLVPGCSAHAIQLNAYLSPTLSQAAVTFP
ncbi:hypothetical protein M409DRAFT_30708 [Zasmidium cellare ATCC 36951]|uniref:Uncharacterized protein n=1 Tax=Zasmidium cellare ATCC 36951 TaxID=1080233 RepID=A0A6A6BZH4_ZASCE|nr:uncharacterized protein M409DRAFT_30708 [Zasmidium cellare ATCC 36951]KAF2158836.1 hypothetical protein M409DRAFT_30708 [Zasmidium cellare ATCC 36951]